MSTHPTTQPSSPPLAPPPAESSSGSGAIPLAVERAERRGAATRVCSRCELPIAVSLRRW
jgi:hypothetical protein